MSPASRLDAPPSVVIAPGAAVGALCELEDEDVAHLRVVRTVPGATLRAVDGAGRCFAARLEHLDRRAARAVLLADSTPPAAAAPTVWLLQGVLHGPRMDWLLEKATELGVAGVVAVQTARAQGGKGEGRAARWERVMRAAFLQSLGLWRPRLLFAQHMQEAAQLASVQSLVTADPDGEPWDTIALGPGPVAVVVGPEGGLTPEERAGLADRGARRVSLGPTRLRAETAALVLTAAVGWREATPGRGGAAGGESAQVPTPA